MAFIKTQNLKQEKDGTISGGTASVVDTIYVSGSEFHSKQHVRERLGKIIELDEGKRAGVFLSPTRGLVRYDADTDRFEVVERSSLADQDVRLSPNPSVHTVFGDTYLLLNFMKKSGLLAILRKIFSRNQDYERMLCHVLHGVLKDGAKISCDNFIAKSFASYVFPDVPLNSLRSDTAFYSMLGDDHVRMTFFIEFIAAMRRHNPRFGSGCYVDSTPLPNDIVDNPFNALSCHGVGSSSEQIRLILVLDEETGYPVWYDLIPGNVLDVSTIMNVINDVAVSLDIEINSLVLDAGYVSKELLHAFHIGSGKHIIARMPARRGYPFHDLYRQVKPLIGKGKYAFIRDKHVYFGQRKLITLFGENIYAYVYVDQNNALQRFREYVLSHDDEYEQMKDKDKDWMTVKNGFFVLLSTWEDTPGNILNKYFERTTIETVFKTSKDYLGLLPLNKWTDLTVRGKILHDVIDTIVVLQLRKALDGSAISISELTGRVQSLMCFIDKHAQVIVDTPNRKTKEYYQKLAVEVPAKVNVTKFKEQVLNLKM